MTETTQTPRASAQRAAVPRQRPAVSAARRGPLPALPLRRLEPWRDCLLLGLLNHGVLLAIVLLHPGVLGLVLLAVPLSVGMATGTLTVLHDAGHRMFAKRAWPNVLAVQLSVPAGLWVGHWTLKHRVHHKLLQVYPLDEATRSSSLLRLHPEAASRPVHRFQQYYAWGLYSLAWAGELKSQLTYLVTGIVTGAETPTTRARVGSFLVEKGLWLAVLTPYVRAIGLGRMVLLLVVAETLASLIAAVTTVVGHVNVGLEPEPGPPGAKWAAHIVRTTASFNTRSVLVRFWTGGLTHHLAHHLRPVALRSELPALHVTAVRDVVAATGVPLSEYPTFCAAVVAHFRRLQELGRPAHLPTVASAASS